MCVRVYKHKVKSLVESEHEFSFDQFIYRLRKCYGSPRSMVCRDTGITESRLVNLETGNFFQFPVEEIKLLSQLYSIPRSLLTRKANVFVAEKVVAKSKHKHRRIRLTKPRMSDAV